MRLTHHLTHTDKCDQPLHPDQFLHLLFWWRHQRYLHLGRLSPSMFSIASWLHQVRSFPVQPVSYPWWCMMTSPMPATIRTWCVGPWGSLECDSTGNRWVVTNNLFLACWNSKPNFAQSGTMSLQEAGIWTQIPRFSSVSQRLNELSRVWVNDSTSILSHSSVH